MFTGIQRMTKELTALSLSIMKIKVVAPDLGREGLLLHLRRGLQILVKPNECKHDRTSKNKPNAKTYKLTNSAKHTKQQAQIQFQASTTTSGEVQYA